MKQDTVRAFGRSDDDANSEMRIRSVADNIGSAVEGRVVDRLFFTDIRIALSILDVRGALRVGAEVVKELRRVEESARRGARHMRAGGAIPNVKRKYKT